MKKLIQLSLIVLVLLGCESRQVNEVTIETQYGNMRVRLLDSTPQHKANFLKLVNEGFYDDLLFHRVIKGFMIQGGDPESKVAPMMKPLGMGGPDYTIPAEIGAPHFKGMLAAARRGDEVNPEKASSGSQFYIVQGNALTAQDLDMYEVAKKLKYSPAQREKYLRLGGAPSLDGDYTVFGEIVEGLEVIDKIAAAETGPMDRPVKDIRMKIYK
ncbi:MAG: peptidylprolyl isomerase [Saprospiraceae bacterium]|jgi:cyclophilin family peptidyl-prolyl cis-trans isomerase|nr:peptidylprolyl isomerase [Saprospiraceae bacterium]